MRHFLQAAVFLILDLASTLIFVVVLFLTGRTAVAVAAGIGLGLVQITAQMARRKPIQAMEWLSLCLVVTAGTATLLTDDPRFVLIKPSLIYAAVGVVMLKRGWMLRYLPPVAQRVVPDVATVVGFVWAGLMLASAAVNAIVATAWDMSTWAIVMPAFGIISKVILFGAGFAAIKLTAMRRVRAMAPADRANLLAATG